ncbi:MAG: transcriptional repressor [Bacteroidaceae bacterium]
MDKNAIYEQLLKENGIKPTAIRLLIFKEMHQFDHTFSLQDIETVLDTVDKSTVFRTIIVLEEHNLIHRIEDGSGSMKYCICHNDGNCKTDEMHCHFYCEKCHQTFCLDYIHIPKVEVAPGFIVRHVNYVMKGICPTCSCSASSK